MNDRYLYRAKHVHAFGVNKKYDGWVYGYLSCENYIYSPEFGVEKLIDPNTICQCTGLKDKNGKLIWENDICDRKEPYPEIVTYAKGDWTLDYSYATGRERGSCYCNLGFYTNERMSVYVIGNIFDNPELLELD